MVIREEHLEGRPRHEVLLEKLEKGQAENIESIRGTRALVEEFQGKARALGEAFAANTELIQETGIGLKKEIQQVDERVMKLDVRVNQRIDTLEKKVDAIDTRVGVLEQKVGVLEQKVDLLDQKVDLIDQKVGVVDQKVGVLDQKIGMLDQKFDQKFDQMSAAILGITTHLGIGQSRLEKRLPREVVKRRKAR